MKENNTTTGLLVDVSEINPRIIIDMKYATDDNFVGKVLYSQHRAFLQAAVAAKLDKVQQALERKGLGLKLWDAYRPHAIQHELWAIMPDERYVADPAKGSAHNRGAAVDVTLVNAQGKELEMPTSFDDFSEKAHYSYINLIPAVLENRTILAEVMTVHGFVPMETEWWHFNDNACSSYAVLDVSFEELLGSIRKGSTGDKALF